jgi:cytochrome c oxidase assembly protein subunit 15
VKLFRGFAVTSAVLAFAIAVLGSWVRINGAGLTCPDWPLCHGTLVPSLHGGVVLEWSHRLVAFIESFVVLGAIVTGFRERRRIAGVAPVLIGLAAIFVAQVCLGGATVLLANSPLSVMLHWGMGMLLLADLTVLAVLAVLAPPAVTRSAAGRWPTESVAPALLLAASFAFVTMCVGAYVSSSYAGLACPTIPFVQMLHRIAAFSFAIVAAIATFAAWNGGSRRVRTVASVGFALVLIQIGLGIGNVVWQLPIALREAHAANAVATFVAFVLATSLAALAPERALAPRAERAVGSRRIAPLA